MARIQNSGISNRIYLSIFQSGLCESITVDKWNLIPEESKPTGFAKVEYVDKDNNPKTKYIKRYNTVSGMITGFNYIKKTFDGRDVHFWDIILTDEEGDMSLQFPAGNRQIQAFIKRVGNIDTSKEVVIGAFKDKEKDEVVLFVKQEGKNVPMVYTKENPNGLPQGKKLSTGKWDFNSHDEFLHDVAIKFSETLPASNIHKATSSNVSVENVEDVLDFDSIGKEVEIPF